MTFQDLEQSNVSKNSKDKNQIRYAAKKKSLTPLQIHLLSVGPFYPSKFMPAHTDPTK